MDNNQSVQEDRSLNQFHRYGSSLPHPNFELIEELNKKNQDNKPKKSNIRRFFLILLGWAALFALGIIFLPAFIPQHILIWIFLGFLAIGLTIIVYSLLSISDRADDLEQRVSMLEQEHKEVGDEQ